MITIHKFEVKTEFTLRLPEGYEILTAKEQHDTTQMWVKLDTDVHNFQEVKFVAYGTGHVIDPELNLKYISTFTAVKGMFVFHLFEVLED